MFYYGIVKHRMTAVRRRSAVVQHLARVKRRRTKQKQEPQFTGLMKTEARCAAPPPVALGLSKKNSTRKLVAPA